MKILLSWIDLNADMIKLKNSKGYTGPTIEAVRQDTYDKLYLFANSEVTFDRASKLKSYIESNRKEFAVKEIQPKFLKIKNPTDYRELWEKVPIEIDAISKKYAKKSPRFFINLSAGTPSMRTTWMMMVGSGQIKATALNVQRESPDSQTTIEKVDVGIYPFVSKIKQEVDKQLDIPLTFNSPQMQQIMRKLSLITGDLNLPILLLGETGTGKTTIAQLYHEMTGAPKKKFYHFVCGEFDVADLNTIKSQLFGHVKGAYTGADQDKEGILAKADGGTLFLDEIGDIPTAAQRLLINAVENKEFRLLGSDDLEKSDFRLICATNRDIKEMLKNDELSQDFYNRIRNCEYEIPPLRERKEDIPLIIDSLLKNEPNYQNLEFGENAKELLIKKVMELSLPGNIRDIQRIMDHLILQSILNKPEPIHEDDIQQYFEEIKEPTQNDEYVDLVHRLIQTWPNTTFSHQGAKWQEVLIEIALKKLVGDGEFHKKNGDLNINKIATLLGLDNKTVKTKLKQI